MQMFGCLSQRHNYFDVERDICETLLTKNQLKGRLEEQKQVHFAVSKKYPTTNQNSGQYLVLHSHTRLSSKPKRKVKNP